MEFPPIIERELRVALRKGRPLRTRFLISACGTGIIAIFLLIFWLSGSRNLGSELHQWIFWGGLAMAIVYPLELSAGLFSEERRTNTLGLLLLTGISGRTLFAGKLLGSVLIALNYLLAVLPLLALAFLLGGMSTHLFVATAVCFPTALLFVVAVGVLASVICSGEEAATVMAVIVVGVLALGLPLPYALGKLLTGAPPFSAAWLCLSPARAAYLVYTRLGAAQMSEFWTATAVTFGWSTLCLGLAAFLLQRTWRQEPSAQSNFWRAGWAWASRGRVGRRNRLRRQRLEQNPWQWLVEQNRRPVALTWILLGGLGALWLLAWWLWPRAWLTVPTFYSTAVLLILVVNAMQLYALGVRLAIDRREGGLEMLLTTPLTPEEIVSGQVAAVRSQFQPVRATMNSLFVLMFLAGFVVRGWNAPAVISYVLVWGVLFAWSFRALRGEGADVAMWNAFVSGRPSFAVFGETSKWSWVWLIFYVNSGLGWLGRVMAQFPTGSAAEVAIVSLAAFVFLIIMAVTVQTPSEMRPRLIGTLRSIAETPVPDPKDPRWSKWKSGQPFPPPES